MTINFRDEWTALKTRLENGDDLRAILKDAEALQKRKVWGSVWWNKERASLIGICCLMCGTTKGRMVLQHPQGIKPGSWKEARDWAWTIYKKNHPLPKGLTVKQYSAIGKKSWKLFMDDKESIFITLQVLIDRWLYYLTFNGTETWCEKCAFLRDKKGMIICSICKMNYHHVNYTKCYECAKEDLEVCPRCKINLKKKTYPTCYDCSIYYKLGL